MKLALIPPRGWERWAHQSNFHLALAQISNGYYTNTYKEAADKGDFIIVDNGAAEGTPVGDFKLFYQAQLWGATEVVLPDVMYDSSQTIVRAKQFAKNIEDSAYMFENFNYMAVAQGRSVESVRRCIVGLAMLPYVRTIGLPRHLIRTLDLKFIRLGLADWINKEFPGRFEIHFLGTHPSVPSEIRRAANETPHVRSCDTSMPFNYAIAGVALTLQAPAIARPQRYLDDFQNMTTGLLRNNIDTMKRWARGE